MAVHKAAFMSLFMRQSGGQRVLPSQDNSKDTQQFSRARLRSIKPFLPHDVTHVRKCTRPSPALPYCKQWEAGRWPGNQASTHAHTHTNTHTNLSMNIVSFPGLHAHQYTKCTDIHTEHMQTQLQAGLPGHANINLVNILPYIYTMSVLDMHVNQTSTPSSAIQY